MSIKVVYLPSKDLFAVDLSPSSHDHASYITKRLKESVGDSRVLLGVDLEVASEIVPNYVYPRRRGFVTKNSRYSRGGLKR